MGANLRLGGGAGGMIRGGDAACILPRRAMARPRRGDLDRDRPGGDGPNERGIGTAPRDPQRRDATAAGAGLWSGRAVAACGGGLGRGQRLGGPVRHGGDGPEHCSGRCARPRTGWARSPARCCAAPRRGSAGHRRGPAAGPPPPDRRWQRDRPPRRQGRGLAAACHLRPGGRPPHRPRIDRRPRRRELRTHGLAGRGRGARRPLLRPPAGAAASGAVPQTLAAGADFVVRTGWARLRLLGADGAPMAWEPLFDALAPGEATDRMVAVDYSGQGRRSRGKATFPARRWRQCRQPSSASRRRRRSGRPRPSAASTCGITRDTSCCRSPCGPPAT
jgi:hypothetical protein